MKPWSEESKVLYNPDERFIDYIMPGIVGLILQLLTITIGRRFAGTVQET